MDRLTTILAKSLFIKSLLTVGFACLLLIVLAAGVAAQAPGTADDEEAEAGPVLQPVFARVVQAVPVTLTLAIPGPTGTITIETPITLALDIRIGIGANLTASVVATPSVALTETVAGEDNGGIEDSEDETTPTSVGVVTPAAATATPTAAPTRPAGATLTPTPADVDATEPETEAEPTPAPTATPIPPTATPVPTAVEETGDEPAEETPTETPAETPEATPDESAGDETGAVSAPSCPDSRAVITAPGVNAVVSGQVDIAGSATHENFQYYKVEYAQGFGVSPDSNFAYLSDSRVQVSNGVLASVDSTTLDNGAYTFKLTVVDNTGNFPPPCTTSFTIQN
jgi:hypothetical protein